MNNDTSNPTSNKCSSSILSPIEDEKTKKKANSASKGIIADQHDQQVVQSPGNESSTRNRKLNVGGRS